MCVQADILCGLGVFARMSVLTVCMSNFDVVACKLNVNIQSI
jgi:hypothetical protein